jgi:hypothetical protein
MKIHAILLIAATSIAPLVISCSGGGGSSGKDPYVEPNPPSPDTAPPYISSAVALSDKTILVTFSETVKAETTGKADNYSIQSTRTPVIVSSVTPDHDAAHVTLTLANSMGHGITYELHAKNIADSSGNILLDGSATFGGRGPVAAILSDLPGAVTNNRNASITVEGTDLKSYQYSVNGGTWSGEKPTSDTIELSGLSDGPATIQVVGKDSMNNWQPFSTPTTYTWTIDTIPPVVQLSDFPARITNSKTVSINVSGDQVSQYKYRLNNRSWSDDIDINELIIEEGLDDGSYTITVTGRDAAGNWQSESSAATCQWVVDTSVPAVTLDGVPATLTNDRLVRATAGGDKVVAFKYRLDGGSWSQELISGSESPIIASGLGEGTHVLEAVGKNEAGTWQNETLSTQYEWKIDLTPPKAAFDTTPENPSASHNPLVTVVKDDDCVNFRYKLDSNEWSGLYPAGTPLRLDDITEGRHTILISGIDTVGNEQKTGFNSFTWTSDFTPPSAVLLDYPREITNVTSSAITVGGTDVHSYKYSLDSGDWSGEILSTSSIALGALPEGTHTIKVVGCDTAGNWQDFPIATSYSWRIDTTPPQAGATNLPANPTSSNDIEITVSGDDMAGYSYRIDNGGWISRDIADKIIASNIAEGQHTVSIKGTDAAGNTQDNPFTYQWTIDRTSPSADLSGLPAAKNNLQTITVSVGGDGLVAYRYSFDGGSYSSDRPATETITLTGITAGTHEFTVVGRDEAGNWQSTSSPARFAWHSDFTPTTAVLGSLPSSITKITTASITVSGDDCVAYRYRLDNGSWSTDIDAVTDLSLGPMNQGTHTLSVLAIDSFGNIQTTPTEYSWTVDTTPPSPSATSDGGTTTENPSLRFTWTVPQDASRAIIQISSVRDFSTIVFESVDIPVSAGNAEYIYSAQEAHGSDVFARVKLGDEAGNWGPYGSASDGITLTGSVTGEVRESYGTVLAEATVTILNENRQVLATTGSDENGRFTFSGIPAGISTYEISVTKSTYNGATKSNVAVHTGSTTDEGLIILVSTAALSGTISGTVVDANNGAKISDATVTILNFRGNGVGTYSTTNGAFTSTTLTPGTYSAVITKSDFSEMRVDNITVNGNISIGNQAICEILTGNHVRVVLLWGTNPKDLDLHVVGPSDKTVAKDGAPNNRFHAYWSQKSFDAASGKYSGESGFISYTTALVQDTTTGFGPEAINTWNLYAKGVYTFTVHNYSKTNWYASSPVIRIYDNLGLVQEIPLPTGAGSEWYWKAFQINIQGDSRDQRSINVVNQFGTLTYSSKSSMDWQAPQGGMAAYLIAVATGEKPLVLIMFIIVTGGFIALFIWNRKRMRGKDDTPVI